jgi:hypothetical protein
MITTEPAFPTVQLFIISQRVFISIGRTSPFINPASSEAPGENCGHNAE